MSTCLRCYSTSLKLKCPEKVRRGGVCLSTQGPLQEQQALKGGEEGGRERGRERRRNSGREGEKGGKPGPEVCFHGGYKSRLVDTGELTSHCSFAAISATTKHSVGRKKFISPCRLQPIIRGSQGRTMRQELKQRWRKSPASWFASLACSVSFLRQPSTDCPGAAPRTIGRTLSHQS